MQRISGPVWLCQQRLTSEPCGRERPAGGAGPRDSRSWISADQQETGDRVAAHLVVLELGADFERVVRGHPQQPILT